MYLDLREIFILACSPIWSLWCCCSFLTCPFKETSDTQTQSLSKHIYFDAFILLFTFQIFPLHHKYRPAIPHPLSHRSPSLLRPCKTTMNKNHVSKQKKSLSVLFCSYCCPLVTLHGNCSIRMGLRRGLSYANNVLPCILSSETVGGLCRDTAFNIWSSTKFLKSPPALDEGFCHSKEAHGDITLI